MFICHVSGPTATGWITMKVCTVNSICLKALRVADPSQTIVKRTDVSRISFIRVQA